jgi:hypothetical protein
MTESVADRDGPGAAAVPSLARIGEAGAKLLPRSPRLARRHVESFEVVSADVFRRSLTMDLRLPEAEAAASLGTSTNRYYVPLASIAKDRPIANADLYDESRRTLPLLNAEDNAEISATAVRVLAADLLGELSPEFVRLIETVVSKSGAERDFYLEYVLLVARREGEAIDPVRARDFARLVEELAYNMVTWVALDGRPGERRVVKFSWDALRFERGYDRPTVPLRVRVRGGQVSYSYRPGGEEILLSRRNRAWRSLMARLGLRSATIGLWDPYVGDCASYHLEVAAPPGLELRDLQLAGEFRGPDGAPIQPYIKVTADRAHLYLRDATVNGATYARVNVRPGAKGGLHGQAAAAIGLTAALLWAFNERSEEVANEIAKGSAAATVLLFAVPLLIALVAARRSHHPLAAVLTSGARVLTLFTATVTTAAAAATVGVTFENVGLGRSFHWYALVASAVAVLVALGWLLGFREAWASAKAVREQWRSRAAYVGTALAVTAGAVATLAGGILWPSAVEIAEAPFIGLLAILAGLQMFVAGHGHEVSHAWLRAIPLFVALAVVPTSIATVVLTLEVSAAGLPWEWRDVWPFCLAATSCLMTAVAIKAGIDWRREANRVE